jgi:hypothetical protein
MDMAMDDITEGLDTTEDHAMYGEAVCIMEVVCIVEAGTCTREARRNGIKRAVCHHNVLFFFLQSDNNPHVRRTLDQKCMHRFVYVQSNSGVPVSKVVNFMPISA